MTTFLWLIFCAVMYGAVLLFLVWDVITDRARRDRLSRIDRVRLLTNLAELDARKTWEEPRAWCQLCSRLIHAGAQFCSLHGGPAHVDREQAHR